MKNESNPTKEEVFSKAVGLDITSEDCHRVHILKETLERGLNAVERHIKAEIQVTKSVSITDEKKDTIRILEEAKVLLWKHTKYGNDEYSICHNEIDELLSRNVISIQRDKLSEVIKKWLRNEHIREAQGVIEYDVNELANMLISSASIREDKKCTTHCDWPNCTLSGCVQRQIEPWLER